MSERLRREILALTPTFSTNPRTGRVELVLRGSGVGLEESQRALDWMARVLHAPDWRSENLPRLRDLVDQQLAALRNTVQARRGELGQRPGQRLAHAAPARLAGERLVPHPHAQRAAPALAAAGPGARRRRGARGLPRRGSRKAAAALDRASLKALLADGKAPGSEALSPRAAHARRRGAARPRPDASPRCPTRAWAPTSPTSRSALRDDLAAAGDRGAGAAGVRCASACCAPAARACSSPRRSEMRGALAPQIESFAARLDASTPSPPLPAGAEALDRRAPAPARRAASAAARRPACAEQAGRRDPHLGARGALRRRGRQARSSSTTSPRASTAAAARTASSPRPSARASPTATACAARSRRAASATTPSARPSCRRPCASSSA